MTDCSAFHGKMAASHYAAVTSATSLRHSHRRFPLATLNPRKPILSFCCFASSFPAKPARRKNHLRQKIDKTLRKPLIPKHPPANPIITTDSPPLQEIEQCEAFQKIKEAEKHETSEAGIGEVEKTDELGNSEVSVPAGFSVDGYVGILAKNPVLNFGVWLVGSIVFQAVWAILGFVSAKNTNEILDGTEKSSVIEVGGNGDGTEKSSVIEVGGNGEGKSSEEFVLNGIGNGKIGVENSGADSMVVDELEMERKIEEIRVMAREAREKERLESKKNGPESEESDREIHLKSEVEEEVDNRLINLRKKLEKKHGKTPVTSVGYLRENDKRKDGVEKGELDERESYGALLFKKKYKFKDSSGDPVEKPKGFTGLGDKRDKGGNRKKGNDDYDKVSLGDGAKQTEPSDVHPNGSEAVHAVEDEKKGVSEMSESTKNTRKKLAKERAAREQGKEKGVARPKVINGIVLEKSNGRSSLEAKSRKLKGKGFGDARLALKGKSETDSWWLNLPYVLVIHMQRGDDGERFEGLYTLKSTSSAEDRVSHIVAFEDRSDASNFCYLLQSFFESLEDFQADVVPLTVQELIESVKSYGKRVIVVKRGQLKLYAGQPLTDAEMALRGMIKQN